MLMAKCVALIPLLNTCAGITNSVASTITGKFGKSSAISPVILYFRCQKSTQWSYWLHMMVKVTGCSGNDFKMSIIIFAGTAILPFSFASTGITPWMEISISVPTIRSFWSSTSKRKYRE
jgi:hypothetical protein